MLTKNNYFNVEKLIRKLQIYSNEVNFHAEHNNNIV